MKNYLQAIDSNMVRQNTPSFRDASNTLAQMGNTFGYREKQSAGDVLMGGLGGAIAGAKLGGMVGVGPGVGAIGGGVIGLIGSIF